MNREGGFLKHVHYLVVEGVVGVGKTSFCHILETYLNAKLVLEEAEENPFMGDFYRERTESAFKVQMWFLLSRYAQLSEISQKDLFHDMYISDYMWEKDRMFANLNLDDSELAIYEKVEKTLERELPRPDFIIYLQASTERLLKNIRERDRPYEREVNFEYIEQLNESYNHFFFNYTDAPVLIIDASDIDFMKNPNELNEILKELNKGTNGTRFFKPPTGVQ